MLAARLLQDAGHEIEEVAPDWRDQDMVTNFRLARQTIAVSYGDPEEELLDRPTRDLQRLARATSALDLHRALVEIRSYASRVASIWDAYDALLTPTLARLPVVHWSRDGLPVGVQLITPARKEIELVRMSLQLEQAQPWAGRWPSRY